MRILPPSVSVPLSRAVELPQVRRAEITVSAGHQFVAGSSNNTDGIGCIGGGEGS